MVVYKLIPHKIRKVMATDTITPEFSPVHKKKGRKDGKYLYAIETDDGKYRLLLVRYGNFYLSPPVSKEEIVENFPKVYAFFSNSNSKVKLVPKRAIEVFSMKEVSPDDLFLEVFRECLSES